MPEKNDKGNAVLKVVVVLAIVAAAVWVALNSFRPTAVVASVKRDAAVDIVTGSITVRADGNLRELKSESPGRVEWCDALKSAAPFKKGDELVRLDSSDLRRTIKDAETLHTTTAERKKIELKNDARLQLAQRAFDEAKRIHDLSGSSDLEFDAARRAFETAKTNLELGDFDDRQAEIRFKDAQAESQRLLDKMTIRAPVDGLVESAAVYPGSIVSLGATVATYYSNDRIVEAKISEDKASKLELGQRAKVRLLNQGSKEFDAKVTKILPYADADTQRYTAYLEIDPKQITPENLKPNSTGEVTITVGEHPDQPLVDRRALFSGADSYYVFVVKDGRVEKRKVETGFVGLNKAEVKKFLAPGELVIVADLEEFHDGQRVRTTPATN